MKTLTAGSNGMVVSAVIRHSMIRKVLLVCGHHRFAALRRFRHTRCHVLGGLRYTAQSVSELRAIGAPTRHLLVPLLVIYSVLEITFGLGVWGAAGQKRASRITGVLLIGLGVVDLVVAPFFPMHLRGTEGTLTDTMHIILTSVTVLLILLIIGLEPLQTKVVPPLLVRYTLDPHREWCLAFLDAPQIAANLPTPWIG